MIISASDNLRNSLRVVQAAKDLTIGWYGTQISEYFSKGTHTFRLKSSDKPWYEINDGIVADLNSDNLFTIAIVVAVAVILLNILN